MPFCSIRIHSGWVQVKNMCVIVQCIVLPVKSIAWCWIRAEKKCLIPAVAATQWRDQTIPGKFTAGGAGARSALPPLPTLHLVNYIGLLHLVGYIGLHLVDYIRRLYWTTFGGLHQRTTLDFISWTTLDSIEMYPLPYHRHCSAIGVVALQWNVRSLLDGFARVENKCGIRSQGAGRNLVEEKRPWWAGALVENSLRLNLDLNSGLKKGCLV